MFPPNGSTIRRLASLHAVRAGPVSTLQRYYQGATTSCRPSRRASLPSLGGTTRCVLRFAPTTSRRNGGGPGVLRVRRPPRNCRMIRWRRQDLPSSWETPSASVPCSSTPAGLHAPDQNGAAARPPLRERRRLPHWDFRSSIAGPRCSLSTLRGVGYPTATQDSLPGAGQALLGGLAYPQGLDERFRGVPTSHPPFPSLLGAIPFSPSGSTSGAAV